MQRDEIPVNRERITPANRLEVIRNKYEGMGLPEEVVQILLEGNNPNTSAAYQSAWKSWANWNLEKCKDPMHAGLKEGLQYLTDLAKKKRSYSKINIHRSMLSDLLEPIEKTQLGQHPITKKLMRNLFRLNPPKPKYEYTWDPQIIMDYFAASEENKEMSLLALSCKTIITDTVIHAKSFGNSHYREDVNPIFRGSS